MKEVQSSEARRRPGNDYLVTAITDHLDPVQVHLAVLLPAALLVIRSAHVTPAGGKTDHRARGGQQLVAANWTPLRPRGRSKPLRAQRYHVHRPACLSGLSRAVHISGHSRWGEGNREVLRSAAAAHGGCAGLLLLCEALSLRGKPPIAPRSPLLYALQWHGVVLLALLSSQRVKHLLSWETFSRALVGIVGAALALQIIEPVVARLCYFRTKDYSTTLQTSTPLVNPLPVSANVYTAADKATSQMPTLSGADAGLLVAAFGGGLVAMLLGSLMLYLEAALRWLLNADPDWRPAWAVVGQHQGTASRGPSDDGTPGRRPASPVCMYGPRTSSEEHVSTGLRSGSAHLLHPPSSRRGAQRVVLAPPATQPLRGGLQLGDLTRTALAGGHPPTPLRASWDSAGAAAAVSQASASSSSSLGDNSSVYGGVGAGRAQGRHAASVEAADLSGAAGAAQGGSTAASCRPGGPPSGDPAMTTPGGQQPAERGGEAARRPVGRSSPGSIPASCRGSGFSPEAASSGHSGRPMGFGGGASTSEPSAPTPWTSFLGWAPSGLVSRSSGLGLGLSRTDQPWERVHMQEVQQEQQQEQHVRQLRDSQQGQGRRQGQQPTALSAPSSYAGLCTAISEVSSGSRAVQSASGTAGSMAAAAAAAAAEAAGGSSAREEGSNMPGAAAPAAVATAGKAFTAAAAAPAVSARDVQSLTGDRSGSGSAAEPAGVEQPEQFLQPESSVSDGRRQSAQLAWARESDAPPPPLQQQQPPWDVSAWTYSPVRAPQPYLKLLPAPEQAPPPPICLWLGNLYCTDHPYDIYPSQSSSKVHCHTVTRPPLSICLTPNLPPCLMPQLATRPGAPYAALEATLLAAAHRTIEDALNNTTVVGEEGGGGSSGNALLLGAAGGAARPRARARWRGYTAQMQCLPGCLELILRVQYESDKEFGEREVAARLEALHLELRRQMDGGGRAAAGAAGVPVVLYIDPPVISTTRRSPVGSPYLFPVANPTSGDGASASDALGEGRQGGSWIVSRRSTAERIVLDRRGSFGGGGGGSRYGSASEALLLSPFPSPLTMSLRRPPSDVSASVGTMTAASASFRAPPLSAVLPERTASAAASLRGASPVRAAAPASADVADGVVRGRRRRVNRATTCDARIFKGRCCTAAASAVSDEGETFSSFAGAVNAGDAGGGDQYQHEHRQTDATTFLQQQQLQHQQRERAGRTQQERHEHPEPEQQPQLLDKQNPETAATTIFRRHADSSSNRRDIVSGVGSDGGVVASPFVQPPAAAADDLDDDDFDSAFDHTRSSRSVLPPPLSPSAGAAVHGGGGEVGVTWSTSRAAAAFAAAASATPTSPARDIPRRPQELPRSLSPPPPPRALLDARQLASPRPVGSIGPGGTQHQRQLRPPWHESPRDSLAAGAGMQPTGPGCVRLDIFLDEDALKVQAGGGADISGDPPSSLAARHNAAPLSFNHVPFSSVDVRVVVKQHGVVVAEVERLSVGRSRGASVSLDLSGLEEGSAALLVLPIRQEPERQQQQQQGMRSGESSTRVAAHEGGREEGIAALQSPCAALVYIPIVVAPPAVAEELCGLMRGMADSAAATGPRRTTDPRVARAHAFTHHFSVLVSDMVSLLLGCERLVEEEEDVEEEAEVARCSAMRRSDDTGAAQDGRITELQQLGVALVSYLTQIGLTATLHYLLEEVRDAGVEVRSGDVEGEEAVQRLLQGKQFWQLERPAEERDAEARELTITRPADAAAARPAKPGTSSRSHEEEDGGEAPAEASDAQRPVIRRAKLPTCSATEARITSGGSGVGTQGRARIVDAPVVPPLGAATWRSVLQGFDPQTEARFEGYLYEQNGPIRGSAAAAAAATAVAAAVAFGLRVPQSGVSAVVQALWAWLSLSRFRWDGVNGGVGAILGGVGAGIGADRGRDSDGSSGGSGGVGGLRRPAWGVHLAVRVLGWAVALPALLLGLVTWIRQAHTPIQLWRRDVLVRFINVAILALLYVYGRCTADTSGDTAAPLLKLLATLLVLVQPVSYSGRLRSYRICWALDAVLLWMLFGSPDSGFTASNTRDMWSMLQVAITVGLILAASMALAAAMDLSQRRRFVRAVQPPGGQCAWRG
ncbi:hypothetical protein VOLCADRAFT_88378 [Volvox carteri f. nagariensis]|uniref:Uncharacterized protein n=1 Tax=Volvox carteri f. nagariensis TaxID=3068 RepID=D8TN73_VOLCA|nr:uncharacterized protein VOLCADRAFT_88378 [Volvox carteri f. nagariensis]EFJ51089.1 hypothetical protein VOLCADRAFT_88378 [Volvox carteri f. nagariensis]|eukprot:XP_002948101.1 hypothetical protein VOLCADRAFT_88378 [Volvox carteri f. nagariensis]